MALDCLSDGWMGVREDVTMLFLVEEGRFSITNHVRPTLAYYIQSQMTATPAAWRRITMLLQLFTATTLVLNQSALVVGLIGH